MPEPLKNLFTRELVEQLGTKISEEEPSFNVADFCNAVFDTTWETRELKDRMRHISLTLNTFMPDSFARSIEILKKVAPGFTGFEFMILPDYVECFGLEHFEMSVEALEVFTSYASAEFAVRPFIKKYPDLMMQKMEEWAGADNEHVRRLASEGCRPRLPWAMALPEFKKNPDPVLRILSILKNDPSSYVRRSVANNLNDISRDNPKRVIELTQKWIGQNHNLDQLLKHGCRTLLKAGNSDVLAMFGFANPQHIQIRDFEVDSAVQFGTSLNFAFKLVSDKETLGKIRLEYNIFLLKKNGSLSAKIFKLSESECNENVKSIRKSHPFKKITTRVYYPGTHKINIVVNGVQKAIKEFELRM